MSASSGLSTPSASSAHLQESDPPHGSAGPCQSVQQLDGSMSQDLEILPPDRPTDNDVQHAEDAHHQQRAAHAKHIPEHAADCQASQAGAAQVADVKDQGEHAAEASLHDADGSNEEACNADAAVDASQHSDTDEQADMPSISELVNSAAEHVAAAAEATDYRHNGQTTASTSSIPSQHGMQDLNAESVINSMQAVQSQHHGVPVHRGGGIQIAAHYPWMRHSVSDAAEEAQVRQQPHVTFGENALLSVAKLQSGKVPLSYVAAAAADKGERTSGMLAQKEVIRSNPMAANCDYTDGLSNESVISAGMYAMQADEQWAPGTQFAVGRHAELPQLATTEEPAVLLDHDKNKASSAAAHNYHQVAKPADKQRGDDDALVHSAAGSVDEEEAGNAGKSGTGSAGSCAYSAASGLSHLMRTQPPWSPTSSSSSSHEDAAQDISQLQAHVLTPLHGQLQTDVSTSQYRQLQAHALAPPHEQREVLQQWQQLPPFAPQSEAPSDGHVQDVRVQDIVTGQDAVQAATAARLSSVAQTLPTAAERSGSDAADGLWHMRDTSVPSRRLILADTPPHASAQGQADPFAGPLVRQEQQNVSCEPDLIKPGRPYMIQGLPPVC